MKSLGYWYFVGWKTKEAMDAKKRPDVRIVQHVYECNEAGIERALAKMDYKQDGIILFACRQLISACNIAGAKPGTPEAEIVFQSTPNADPDKPPTWKYKGTFPVEVLK